MNSRQRLAQYVATDRARLYRSRSEMARAASVSARTIEKIETGERINYRASTQRRIEDELGWAPGSIGRVIDGGQPRYIQDPDLARLVSLWPLLSRDARAMVTDLVARAVEAGGRGSLPPGPT